MSSTVDISKNTPGTVKLPSWIRVYNSLMASFDWPSIQPTVLLLQAISASKVSDYSAVPALRTSLSVLCQDINTHAELSPFGKLVARRVIIDNLVNRIRIDQAFKQSPELEASPIRQPIFIVGLPRTGTTILFNLLALDAQHRSPRTWEVDFPYPAPDADDYQDNPRIVASQKAIKAFHKLAPAFNAIHPQGANLAEEDQRILAMNFSGCGFQHFFRAPMMQKMQLQEDGLASFAWHKQYLQYLQSNFQKPRWLLKSPDNALYLKAIFATYPDALIINTHRNPASAIASVASLTDTVRRVFSASTRASDVGQDQLEFWSSTIQRCMRDRVELNREHCFIDVRFGELVTDPMGVIRQIYSKFKLPLAPATELKMQQFLAANARGKHGAHRYTLEQFGLRQQDIDAAFHEYQHHYLS